MVPVIGHGGDVLGEPAFKSLLEIDIPMDVVDCVWFDSTWEAFLGSARGPSIGHVYAPQKSNDGLISVNQLLASTEEPCHLAMVWEDILRTALTMARKAGL